MFIAISLAANISWFLINSWGFLLKWAGCQVPELLNDSTEFPRELKRFHCHLFFWEGIGTCEGGPEEHGSLRDKGRSLLTHPRRRLSSLPLSSFPDELFQQVWHLVNESLSIWFESLSQIPHAEGGKMSQMTLPPPPPSLAQGKKKSSGYMYTEFLPQVSSLFHPCVKISAAEGGTPSDNMIQANSGFLITRPYCWGMEGYITFTFVSMSEALKLSEPQFLQLQSKDSNSYHSFQL